MQLGEALKADPVDLIGGGNRDDAVGEGLHRRGAPTAFEDGPFADDGAGAELADRIPVDRDADRAVEDQVQLVARLALLGEQGVGGELADGRLGAGSHDRGGELSFERASRRR